jgi:hypothetical protein
LMLSYIYKKKSQEQNMQNNNLIPWDGLLPLGFQMNGNVLCSY